MPVKIRIKLVPPKIENVFYPFSDAISSQQTTNNARGLTRPRRWGNGGFGRATCDMRRAQPTCDMRHATVASRKVVMSLAHVACRTSHVLSARRILLRLWRVQRAVGARVDFEKFPNLAKPTCGVNEDVLSYSRFCIRGRIVGWRKGSPSGGEVPAIFIL